MNATTSNAVADEITRKLTVMSENPLYAWLRNAACFQEVLTHAWLFWTETEQADETDNDAMSSAVSAGISKYRKQIDFVTGKRIRFVGGQADSTIDVEEPQAESAGFTMNQLVAVEELAEKIGDKRHNTRAAKMVRTIEALQEAGSELGAARALKCDPKTIWNHRNMLRDIIDALRAINGLSPVVESRNNKAEKVSARPAYLPINLRLAQVVDFALATITTIHQPAPRPTRQHGSLGTLTLNHTTRRPVNPLAGWTSTATPTKQHRKLTVADLDRAVTTAINYATARLDYQI